MENKNSYETTLEKFQSTIKLSLFQTYYKLISNQFEFRFIYIVFLCFEALSNIILIVFNMTYSDISQNVYSDVQYYLKVFRIFLLLYPYNNYVCAFVFLLIFLVLFLIQLFTFLFHYRNDSNINKQTNYFKNMFFKFLLVLNLLYVKVLFYPIMITVLSMIQLTTNTGNSVVYLNYPNQLYTPLNYILNIIISSLVLILYFSLMISNLILFNDNRPITTLPSANPNNTINIFYLFFKFFLCFFYIFNFGSSQFYFKIILIILTLVLIKAYRFWNPIYHQKIIFNVSVYLGGKQLYFAIISCINWYTNLVYSLDNLLLLFITSICFGLLSLNIVFKIQNFYKYQNLNEVNSENFAFNKIMLLMEEAKEFKINNYNKSIFLGLVQKHRIKCINHKCDCHTYLKVLNEKSFKNIDKKSNQSLNYKKNKRVIFDDESLLDDNTVIFSQESVDVDKVNTEDLSINECLYGIIKIYLEEFIEKFPKSTELIITYIYLITYYLDNVFKSLFEIMKFSKKKFGIFNEFELYYLHNEIEKMMYKSYLKQFHGDINIENVLKYNNLSLKIIDEMEKTTHRTIEFWTEVKSSSDKSKLYKAAVNISNSIRDMKSFSTELINDLEYKDINFYKLYCDFLEKIIFHEQDAIELREKLKLIQNDLNNITLNENDSITTFVNMDDVGTVVISGNLSEIGKILSVNIKFCSIFKFENSQLLRNSINKIIPQYLSQFHDSFIKRYMETAKKHVLDDHRIVFGLVSTGFIIPILIHVKVIPNLEESIRFIGLVKKLKKNDQFFFTTDSTKHLSTSFILCNSQGNLYGITKNVCKNFGIPLNLLLNQKGNSDQTKILNIKTIFTELNFDEEDIFRNLKSNQGALIKLNSISLKNFYEDFKETLLEAKNKTFQFLKSNQEENDMKFIEHEVLAFMNNWSFNNGQIMTRVFKIVKLNNDYKLNTIIKMETKTSFSHKMIIESKRSVGFNPEVNIPTPRSRDIIKKLPVRRLTTLYKQKNTDKDKYSNLELNKYKKNLFSLDYPKQVKVFIFFVIIFLSFFTSISIAELIFTNSNNIQIQNFFEMWGSNLKKNLFFSSIISYFQNLVLFDNNLYTNNLFPNDSKQFRNLIINKIIIDINRTLDIYNNVTYTMDTFDKSIDELYNFKIVSTNNLESNMTITLQLESLFYLEYNILLKISKLINQTNLSFNNSFDVLFNSYYFSLKNSSILSRDLFYVLNNSYGIYRLYTEKLQFEMDSILVSGNLFKMGVRDNLVITPFVICFLQFIIFFFILTSVINYKIKILKIFFLIENKWSDIIIRRCQKYLEQSRDFLKMDNNKNKDKNFFDEKDDIEYLENELRIEEENKKFRDLIKFDKEKDVSIENAEESRSVLTNNNNNKNIINRTLNNKEKNDISRTSYKKITGLITDTMKRKIRDISIEDKDKNMKESLKKRKNQISPANIESNVNDGTNMDNLTDNGSDDEDSKNLQESISNFRRTRWINSFQILFLLLLISIYFIIVIVMNKKFFSDFSNNSNYITLIGNRGWSFNNLLIYYRQMIIQGRKVSNYNYIDESGLYTYTDLDSIDLYSLYFNKSTNIENTIQNINGLNINLLNNFLNIDNQLNTNNFCPTLQQFDNNFYNTYQTNCNGFMTGINIVGLSNYIGFIRNYCYNNFYLYSNKLKSLNLNKSTIQNLLTDSNLAFNFDVTQLIIDQAFLLDLTVQCESINSFINTYSSYTFVRTSFFLLLCILEAIFFFYLANLLKKMINEDKAILTIIPWEAICKNEKIKKEFSYL